jgi:hypothetical protein
MTALAEMGTPAAVPDYFDTYGNLHMQRTPSGVLMALEGLTAADLAYQA